MSLRDAQVQGERATLDVLRQLQGFEIPANAWERQILSRRIANYDPKWLDQLCLTGAVGWGRLSPHPATLDDTAAGKRRVIPTSVAPITFFVREEADWMTPHHPSADLGSPASSSPKPRPERRCAAGAGFPAPARSVILRRHRARHRTTESRGGDRAVGAGRGRTDHRRWLRQSALADRSQTTRRARQRAGGASPAQHGRWALLYTDQAADRNRAVEATCWMLLKRYGIVFRDLLARETNLPKWRELQMAFRRLEDRGEIRGGRFVDGFLGEQFALPVAVESLRATRKMPQTGETISSVGCRSAQSGGNSGAG